MIESKIKAALIALLDGIKAADAAAIETELGHLDRLLAEHGGEDSPQLRHYLERRSYAKALDFLGGGRPAAGTCAPKRS